MKKIIILLFVLVTLVLVWYYYYFKKNKSSSSEPLLKLNFSTVENNKEQPTPTTFDLTTSSSTFTPTTSSTFSQAPATSSTFSQTPTSSSSTNEEFSYYYVVIAGTKWYLYFSRPSGVISSNTSWRLNCVTTKTDGNKFGFINNKFCAKLADDSIVYLYTVNSSYGTYAYGMYTAPTYNSDTTTVSPTGRALRFPGGNTAPPNNYVYLNFYYNNSPPCYWVSHGVYSDPSYFTWYTET